MRGKTKKRKIIMSVYKVLQEHIMKPESSHDQESNIKPGDLCWFKAEQKAHIAGTGAWKKYARKCLRVIYPNDPIVFVKKFEDKNYPGKFIHYIECLGLRYVLIGPANPLTLATPYERGINH